MPVPDHVDVATMVNGEYWHFYVPQPTWAFATLHASRRYGPDMAPVSPSPSFFFATAMKESSMGCSYENSYDPQHAGAYFPPLEASWGDGCFQFENGTAFVEMNRMFVYPFDQYNYGVTHTEIISSLEPGQDRDNFETSALAAGYYHTFAYGMFCYHEHNPTDWLNSASDPMAADKMMAVVYNRGAWDGEFIFALEGCNQAQIEDCLSYNSVVWQYVTTISAVQQELETAVANEECYHGDITEEIVTEYVENILPLFPDTPDFGVDHAAVLSDALAAFNANAGGQPSADFQDVGGDVVDAIDAHLPQLYVPYTSLVNWYIYNGSVACNL